MIDFGRCYLCVRDIDVTGAPVMPGSWSVTPQDAGWFTLRRSSDGLVIAAWRANSLNGRALFALFGPVALLETIAAAEPACMPAQEAWDRRAESAVRAWLRRWPVWRFDGFERDSTGNPVALTGAVRRLVFEGQQIPDPTVTPFPWRFALDGTIVATDGAAQIRVNAVTRPSLERTLAGFTLHGTMETEPPR